MKKKRSKAYKPKYVSACPMTTFFGGMSDQHAEHLQKLNIINAAAMQALVQGRGTKADWDRIVGAINMANVMCEQGIGNEFRPQTIAARDALCEVGKRFVRSGRFMFKGDEMRVINEAMACHEAQCENVRAVDIERAADEVIRRIRHGVNTTNVKAEIAKEQQP